MEFRVRRGEMRLLPADPRKVRKYRGGKMKVRRLRALLLGSIAAAAIGVFGMAPMVSASVPAPRSTAGHPVTVINLQQGYLAKLAAHHKQGRIAGIVHPRNKQPK